MATLAPAAGTYWVYETLRRVGQPQRKLLRKYSKYFLQQTFPPIKEIGAVMDAIGQARLTHTHPGFCITEVPSKGKLVMVTEEVVQQGTFGNLLHFRKHTKSKGPKLLLIAPMSGHFATLIRGTVLEALPEHDVYVTDWHNARDIPLFKGTFDLDDYVEYLMTYLKYLGREANVIAICQAAVPALIAVSLLSQDNQVVPATLTLMAAPIDPRVNPTKVNEFATSHTLSQFKTSTINYVPWPLLGAGRPVYPGFRQVGGFMSMNMSHHYNKHQEHFRALMAGDTDSTTLHRTFYDEYCAVMDLTAEFYLDTVERVFRQFQLPQGQFLWRGDRLVELGAITETAVLAIEGGADDITGVGQTKAALNLLTGLSTAQQAYHLESEAGHYGVFNGRRFKQSIMPTISQFIQAHR